RIVAHLEFDSLLNDGIESLLLGDELIGPHGQLRQHIQPIGSTHRRAGETRLSLFGRNDCAGDQSAGRVLNGTGNLHCRYRLAIARGDTEQGNHDSVEQSSATHPMKFHLKPPLQDMRMEYTSEVWTSQILTTGLTIGARTNVAYESTPRQAIANKLSKAGASK